MTQDVITLDQAIAQGSTWSQMLSVAKFHETMVAEKSRNDQVITAMPAWKAKVYRSIIAKHRRIGLHFRSLAQQMRRMV